MGAPELPNDPGEENLCKAHIVLPSSSDDSDDSPQDVSYDGYQPLAVDENHGDDDYSYREGVGRIMDGSESVEAVHSDPSIPQIEAVDVEIEREVWSQPRPQELEIELDSNKTQQILNAMANFELPDLVVPDWAAEIPEERWKEELLQRIRQRKPANESSKIILDKELK